MIITIFSIIAFAYLSLIVLLYFAQEKLIFFPNKLPENFKFQFRGYYEEKWIATSDKQKLNALLFKTPDSKGVILYLHGNAGALDGWGEIAPYYIQFGYDIMIVDYRGYGKSSGKIYSEAQMFDDIQRVYNVLKENYNENQIVILGYSIGTGMAAYLASKNKPKKLVLLAPYYNMPFLLKSKSKLIPAFLLKYRFMTNEYIVQVKAPIAFFHGKNDGLIDFHSSEKLFKLFKPTDVIHLIPNQQHAGMDENPIFLSELEKFLLQ
jgi:uncharacterized protein